MGFFSVARSTRLITSCFARLYNRTAAPRSLRMGCSRTPARMRCLKGERSGLSASSSSISFAFARAALSASESFASIALFGFGVDAGVDADADAGVALDFVARSPRTLGVCKNRERPPQPLARLRLFRRSSRNARSRSPAPRPPPRVATHARDPALALRVLDHAFDDPSRVTARTASSLATSSSLLRVVETRVRRPLARRARERVVRVHPRRAFAPPHRAVRRRLRAFHRRRARRRPPPPPSPSTTRTRRRARAAPRSSRSCHPSRAPWPRVARASSAAIARARSAHRLRALRRGRVADARAAGAPRGGVDVAEFDRAFEFGDGVDRRRVGRAAARNPTRRASARQRRAVRDRARAARRRARACAARDGERRRRTRSMIRASNASIRHSAARRRARRTRHRARDSENAVVDACRARGARAMARGERRRRARRGVARFGVATSSTRSSTRDGGGARARR